MYDEKPIKEYLEELSSKSPVPGGGSVAGLIAALGVSLMEKVINFTVGKKEYMDVEKEMTNILTRCRQLRENFQKICSEDAEAYKKFSDIIKTSKEKNKIQEALNETIAVPVRLCKLSYEAIKLCLSVAHKANRNLITDTGIASLMFQSAFQMALLNVEVNLKKITNPKFILEVGKSLRPLEEDVTIISEEIAKEVEGYLEK